MNSQNINRLKKYLALVSMFFSFLIGWHIIYVYLYHDAKEFPVEWWSVSEWIIWEFPHLNPLITSNDYNKNINYLLYRSLLKYDFEKNEIVWDLADCNIKNLAYIECYLKENLKWSNWENITWEDVVATYNIIKNSDINNSLWNFLKETTIKQRNWIITFSNKIKDINFLNIFFQPIVSKNVLDNIWNKELYWKFNPIDGVFSGPYKIDTISYDDSLWIQKLILVKNENYNDSNILISKYIFKIFKDEAHFLKLKDSVNIFFDKTKIIWDTIPRLNKNSYFLNQYVSLFINEERIKNTSLRNFILSKVDNSNIIKNLWSSYKEVTNAFLLEWVNQNNEIKDSNLENIIKENWFYKKDYLISTLVNKEKSEKNPTKINSDLVYISSPITKKYSFLNSDNILLEWNIKDKKPEEIYINDYKLINYKIWDNKFYYRLRPDYNNLTPGENNYKIEFVIWWKKELVEEFSIIYSSDKEKLSNLEKNYFKIWNTLSSTIDEISEEKIKQIYSLDTRYYYDLNLNKFVLRLYYIDNKIELSKVANLIKNSLESYGILVETLPISINDLNKKVLSQEKDYDMILVWIDLGYFDFNIYSYFHSSQAKEWFNFSNIKNLNLDILLEELNSNILSKEKRIELQKKIIEILNNKQIFKTIYSKENIVLVDKNINWFNLKQNIYWDLAINDAINKSYVTSEKEIVFENKWVFDFFKFIKKVFNNEW